MSVSLTFTTSGTTGEPKAVTHTLEAMLANARAFNEAAGLGPLTSMYHCLPQTHMAGVLNTILCPSVAGGKVMFGSTFSAQTAANFWSILRNSHANTVWLTPTMVAMLLRLNRGKLDVTRRYREWLWHVFCGTAPLPLAARTAWLDTFGIPLQESYGTSEHMLVTVQSRKDAAAGEHNVGKPLPGIKVEIGDAGEILVNGSPTGDQGELKDGKLTVTGRLKDLIIRGGFNVSPARIEERIRKCAYVVDAAVIGEPDAFWGERIVAFVEGGQSGEAIAVQLRKDLPKSHWPDEVFIVDKLPRNEMGKVQKSRLLNIPTA